MKPLPHRSIPAIFAALVLARAAAVESVVLAHRGASGYLPEHSLPAKAVAHVQGADFVEQDLVLTRDDVPIVLHDIHLDTTTDVAERFPGRQRQDGRYYAIDFTLAEIRQLKASPRFDLKTHRAAYPNRFPLAGHTYPLHTFEEEILFLQGLSASTGRTAGLYTEIKQPTFHRQEGRDIARIVTDILKRHGYGTPRQDEACWIQCFEESTLRRLRTELGWKGKLMMILGNKPGADGTDYDALSQPAGMQRVATFANAIGPGIGRVVSWDKSGRLQVSDFTRNAHAAGLQVHWGVVRRDDLPDNCPSLDALHAALFDAAGSEGGFTDFPDLTVQWLQAHPRR